jgi:hypothetical protein
MEYGRVAGTIEVCGCISGRGVNRIFLMKGGLNSQQYITVLNNINDSSSVDRLLMLVQDHHPVHMSKAVQSYIYQSQRLELLP